MDLKIKQFKFLIYLIIFSSIFPKITPILQFTYPQSTTLSDANNHILVIEKNGIHICDSQYSSIIRTLHSFSEEDKIMNESRLSTTVIKKSSLFILIFSNYKLYIVKTSTGALLYKSNNKIITDAEPEYVSLAHYVSENNIIFIVGYIDSYNYLNIKCYKFIADTNTLSQIGTTSLNKVTRTYSGYSYTFNFQNKGLSCDYMKDTYYPTSYAYFTCFLIGAISGNDFLIPVTFKDESNAIKFINNIYVMDYFKIDSENKQIKSHVNSGMVVTYVCYVTGENIGSCLQFHLDKTQSVTGYFDNQIIFTKNCRADIYGMKVTFIFENGDILFSCIDLDGSLQVFNFYEDKKYVKYLPCTNMYGYSVIYLNDLANYYVTSDVTCPEGKLPYDILIEPSGYSPPYISPDTTSKEIIVESTSLTKSITSEIMTTISNLENKVEESTNKIDEKSLETTIVKEAIEKIKTTQLINNEITEKAEEINDCPEMCLKCNSQNECTECNKKNNYYMIELTSSPEAIPSQTVECINQEIKQILYPNYYLDPFSETFKTCYDTCATCIEGGDGNNNNCITCDTGYILHPEYNDSKNCVPKPNSLYYIKYDQYTVTNSDRCPEDFNFLIEEKKKCIEDCKKDSKYKYTYDGLCFESPPENTNDEDGDFICKDNENTCVVTRKKLYTLTDMITDEEIEILTLKYIKEYNYTNYHISIYENNIYIITIYKKGECISELGILSKTIDFKSCYTDIQTKYEISQDTNLIIVQIETKPGKEAYKKNPSYGLHHPKSGKSFKYEIECKEQKVTIQNNITEELNNSKVSFDHIKVMAEQGLDLFDPSCPFYNDLCTHYPDILNKDIPLKKRILAYYPDIELCDNNCDVSHIFLGNLTVKCECSISEGESQKDEIKDNALYKNEFGELEELVYSTNINVIICYKDLFKMEYFSKCYGGIIILGLIFIQIFCIVIYFTKSRFHLKKYFFSLTNKYLNYLKNKKASKEIKQKPLLNKDDTAKISIPPRKKSKNFTVINAFDKHQSKENKEDLGNNSRNDKNIIVYENKDHKRKESNSSEKRKKSKSKTLMLKSTNFTPISKISLEKSASDNLMDNLTDDFDINIKEFLKTDPGNMDYDDSIRRDKRSFCRYYFEKIQSGQIILNTFCHKEYLKPLPIKIMLLVLQIELYFFINGLFYNEEYVTKLFEQDKDSFAKQAWRFFDNLFYAFLVGAIINYVIEFFFIEEKKLRVTLKREKKNLLVLKYEMVQIVKNIQKRFLSFIIISFIISVFIWYHISCFNNVYKHMKKEWLVFSVLIIVCVQIISLLTSLLETILRFLSFRFKSEKMFKLSLIFS